MTKNYNAVREMIVAAVPGLGGCTKSLAYCGNLGCTDTEHTRPIGLEDALRAMKSDEYLMRWVRVDLRFKDGKLEFGYDDHADENSYPHWYEWTLGLPLDQQPEEVIDFLYSILIENV